MNILPENQFFPNATRYCALIKIFPKFSQFCTLITRAARLTQKQSVVATNRLAKNLKSCSPTHNLLSINQIFKTPMAIVLLNIRAKYLMHSMIGLLFFQFISFIFIFQFSFFSSPYNLPKRRNIFPRHLREMGRIFTPGGLGYKTIYLGLPYRIHLTPYSSFSNFVIENKEQFGLCQTQHTQLCHLCNDAYNLCKRGKILVSID